MAEVKKPRKKARRKRKSIAKPSLWKRLWQGLKKPLLIFWLPLLLLSLLYRLFGLHG
ncbi:hypothetical protein BAZMOX_53679_0 [methanotrophic endosymbiont of Bathymodiolus azoricus (Menez Gwen)]|nr:hypothetical protein BAZMOX_53679_0 [methanotrophic endosymbiont of Bathymodiolus azoricus (Menez Gwen)]